MTIQEETGMPQDTPGDVINIGHMTIRYLRDGSASQEMRHSANDEFIHVLEGVLRYRVDDERDLSPGQWMFTPRGSVHAFSNPHSAPARALVTNTPDIGAA
jgi:uncharacterized cupin superfamily protein